jgi:hypothetical protein
MLKNGSTLSTLLILSLASCFGSDRGATGWNKAGADDGLKKAFERVAYSVKASGNGFQVQNPAQRLSIDFETEGTRLQHPDGSLSMRLTGYGYGDRLNKPEIAKLSKTGNRVEYLRGDLTEWYVNESAGLEQGFTLSRRRGKLHQDGPLVIELAVSGGLHVLVQDDVLLFNSDGGTVLRYGGL